MKRFLAPVLAFVCSLLLCGTALAADAAPPAIPTEGDVWDGTTEAPTTIVQKDGVSYYEITKCSQLAYLATVDEDSEFVTTYNYILGNNLILNDVVLTWDKDGNLLTDTATLHKWTPIPNVQGTVQGNGHIISGLYINGASSIYSGLFSEVKTVNDLHLVNSHVQGASQYTGGLAGYAYKLDSCSVSGVIKSTSTENYSLTGGLVGLSGYTSNSVNYAAVYGEYDVGGIEGVGYWDGATNCKNYGAIVGNTCTGGISGSSSHSVKNCENFGSVTGKDQVGGISGSGSVSACCNYGRVFGVTEVGGISGSIYEHGHDYVRNCYNVGNVQGTDAIGGIFGNSSGSSGATIANCYNVGTVAGTTYVGSVVGKSGTVWGKGSVKHCYYLKNETITGFGNGADVENSVTAATATELKDKDTYSLYEYIDGVWIDFGWSSERIWAIDPEINGGYPYLQWQSLDTIPVTGVSLNKTALALGVGDAQYLTATVSPVTAETTLSWKSSDTEVATVTKSGKVTALAPGSAIVTVTTKDGGFSASCTVTVTARAQDEYRLGTIQPESMSGETLTAIPKGSFWACVPLTHLQESGNAVVMLATYDAAGRYLNALCARAEDLPKNSTVRLSLLVDNSGGEAARMKAFVVPSLSEPMPIGAAAAQ